MPESFIETVVLLNHFSGNQGLCMFSDLASSPYAHTDKTSVLVYSLYEQTVACVGTLAIMKNWHKLKSKIQLYLSERKVCDNKQFFG